MAAAASPGAPIDVAHHQSLVWKVVRRFRGWLRGAQSVDENDLFQAGMIAMAQAAERYDWRGPFSTYAIPCIERAVRRELVRNMRAVYVPDEAHKSRAGTPGHTVDVFRKARGRGGKHGPSVEERRCLIDLMPDRFPPEPGPDVGMELGQLRAEMRSLVSRLQCPRRRRVIRLRFFVGKSLEEAGKLLGVSTERARQLEASALRQLEAMIGKGKT